MTRNQWTIGAVLLAALAAAAHGWEPDMSKYPTDKAALPAWLENMRAGQVVDAVRQGAVCLLPVGTVEAGPAGEAPLGIDAARLRKELEALAKKRKAVIAPAIWYAPTGYILSGPKRGTFHMKPDPFAKYVGEVLATL